MSKVISYGSWPSPISSDLLTRQSVRLGEPQLTDAGIYWLESRPQEGGRSVLMQQADNGLALEVLPAACNVRSRAHEYGGGSYLVAAGQVFFVEAEDQRVYVAHSDPASTGAAPQPLTPAGPWRYADFCYDGRRQRLLCVREEHSDSGAETRNSIVAISLTEPLAVTVLIEGHDFFSNPRLSPDGSQLSWLCWDHPAMPWDSSQCWCAPVTADGSVGSGVIVAGGKGESIFQPQWSPDGTLYLVSDRSNWWNIYRVNADELAPVAPLNGEFATPQWVFGMSTYGFLSAQEMLACFTEQGQWYLARIDLGQQTLTRLELPFCDISQVQCCNSRGAFLAASHTRFTTLYLLDDSVKEVVCSSQSELAADWLSQPQPMTFPSGKGTQAHGFFYPPCNPKVSAPAGDKPPLVVLSHGGPTGATETGLNLKIQYWTSRGFAVMDVNYRGSTGYGRHYRDQLKRAWGVHDVEDVCAAATHLVDLGLVNPDQLIIKGSSAGGYTVLAALTFAATFSAGASLYGIGNLETLARDTHKFESRYLDSLVGEYPAERELYLQRSPLCHTGQLNCPVIFFQGLEDKVVPPDQAETMVQALKAKGIPVAYVPFPGEGHGFRGAASIQRCLEAEWSFYGQVFDFPIPAEIEPVAIDNLLRHNPVQRT